MAITLSAHLLSHPFEVKAEETEAETVASQTDTGAEPSTASETAEPAIPQTEMPAATEEADQTATAVQEAAAETVSPQEESVPAENTTTADQSAFQPSPAAVQTAAEETDNPDFSNPAPSAEPAEEAAIVNASSSPEQATAAQDVILAAYKYANPSDPYWTRITSMTGLQIPYVIINPSNGSGSAPIDNFSKQIAANTAAGIKSLGYINTQEFSRSHSDLLAEVDRYTSFYGSNNIAGIFFDEAQPGETAEEVSYMNTLYNAVKSKYPHMTVMANPGRTVTNAIAPFADIWLTRETTADDYLNGYYEQLSDMEKDPASSKRTMHLVHSASPSQYDQIISLSRERNAGYLMVTDRSFLELPSDFENLVNRINSGGNGSAAPSTAPAVPEANQSQGQASQTAQQPQETPTTTAENSAETSRTGFFRIPSGERRRASRQTQPEVETAPTNEEQVRNLYNPAESGTAAREDTAANQGGEKVAEKTASQDNEKAERETTTSSRDRAENRGNRAAEDEAGRSEEEQGRNSRDRSERDQNRDRRQAFAFGTQDQEEGRSEREKADTTESREAKKDSQAQDKNKNTPPSKQASAKRDTAPSAADNSGAALAILGGLTLVGIGIYIGRALLKPKK